jgi:folate-binding protein YgfZ
MISSLRELHASLGARFQSDPSGEWIAGYSDVGDEYAALREGAALVDRSARAKLRITGSDRVALLHGLTTNDIKKLPEGGALYTAMLTVKGHLVADARVVRRRDDLLLDSEPGLAQTLLEHLDHYLISEDAQLHDATGELGLLSFAGLRAREAAAALFGPELVGLEELETREIEGGLLVGTRLAGAPGVDAVVSMERAAALLGDALERGRPLGLRLVGEEALEIARVETGVPRFGRDLGPDTIPLEASLERAISYDKGCYLGQEVIARATFRGQVRRKLAGFRLPGPLAPRTELFKAPGETKQAGLLTTVVQSPRLGWIALGYARRECLSPGTELVTAEGARVQVAGLPFEASGR